MEPDFCKLALEQIGAVYRLAYHLSPRAQDADDLVQETYLHAFRSAHDFHLTHHGLRPWLFKILHNVANRRFGCSQRETNLFEQLRRGRSSEAKGLLTPPPEVRIDWEHVDGRLKRAIDELPLINRSVFLLWAIEGLRYRQIAEITGVPVGTVTSRLHRARSALSARLHDLAAERGMNPVSAGCLFGRRSGGRFATAGIVAGRPRIPPSHPCGSPHA